LNKHRYFQLILPLYDMTIQKYSNIIVLHEGQVYDKYTSSSVVVLCSSMCIRTRFTVYIINMSDTSAAIKI